QYETSSRAVLSRLGVKLVDIPELNCCGYPLRNIDLKAFVLSSARNLALAERQNLNIMMLCKCGYGTMRMAQHLMNEDASLREEVNGILAKEGLTYEGDIEVKHLLTALFKDVGIEKIKEEVTRPFKDLKIATHYGCHALRPSNIMQFDDPGAPSLFDQLVEATGAESVDWPARLDCCGGPLLGTNDALSFDFTRKKLADAKKAGAHYMATGCTFCQIQFDTTQGESASSEGTNGYVPSILYPEGTNGYVPSILYPQLLGVCMGIDKRDLGLDMHQVDITGVESYLSPQTLQSA
ncbi:MAG: CoB--CoM heterodisulfide reductase iron-sulfur subunit B family protein, partial [Deltaproteobacteria bacterium]|nr:CoB--CoM heterodisulfide reductase iron-sulfur subunit B family protein [Deltaproteobacteria bacterium]